MIGAALEMTGVSKAFGGISALEDAHLSIQAGEAHALMGANGAGKSTLMNILGGIVAPEGGEIRIAGRVASIASPRDAASAIVFLLACGVMRNQGVDHHIARPGIEGNHVFRFCGRRNHRDIRDAANVERDPPAPGMAKQCVVEIGN